MDPHPAPEMGPGASGGPVPAYQAPDAWPGNQPPPGYPPGQRLPVRSGRRRRIGVVVAVVVLAAGGITAGILATRHSVAQPKPAAILADPAARKAPGREFMPFIVPSVAFSPDGKTLAAADSGGHIYLWSTATRSITAILTDPAAPHDYGPILVAFSPDGKTLAAADSNGRTYLWSTATRAITATLADPGRGDGAITSIAFSPDGRTLAVAEDGTAYLRSTITGRITATLTNPGKGLVIAHVRGPHGADSVAFSPDGKTLAVADFSGSTYLWSTTTHAVTATLPYPGPDPELLEGGASVAFSPDGQTLATSHEFTQTTYLWSTATHARIAALTDPPNNPPNGVQSVVFSPDGQTLAIVDGPAVYLWATTAHTLSAILFDQRGKGTAIDCAVFSPDGRTLAAGEDFPGNATSLWQLPG